MMHNELILKETTIIALAKQINDWNPTIRRVLKSFIDMADNAKGLASEYLAMFLINSIDGLEIMAHDSLETAEEVELLVANESDQRFWQEIGNPFLVECKNWSKPLGAKDIRNLKGVMESKNIRTAILISRNGVTGDERHDALLLIREAHANNRFIVVLDQADLLEIANGIHPSEKIRQRFYALYKL